MPPKKKLQVFISSTYTDLQEERQAAVQAILTAGHIPAGMELFAAGDETQMNVIKRWIDESDVYMLILGGRYGSIEPKSQKSYIHLEYEYALEKDKPLFAVVIEKGYLEKKVKKNGTQVIELEHPDKVKGFRELVCSKMVRFWSDPNDIKLAILETIADFTNRPDLVGWIPGNETVNTGAVAEELAKLTKENSELRERVSKGSAVSSLYNGLTYEEMITLLEKKELLNFVKDMIGTLASTGLVISDDSSVEVSKIKDLSSIGLVDLSANINFGIGIKSVSPEYTAKLSEVGKMFFARFQLHEYQN
jgi:hypothetical protein